ncbi:MAG: hypothetical protein ACD_10C00761G0002 [uncultured bacterium]|nr:MAG: hypothetical protein ACD_10C00761G0002 [uncultured bacterium]
MDHSNRLAIKRAGSVAEQFADGAVVMQDAALRADDEKKIAHHIEQAGDILLRLLGRSLRLDPHQGLGEMLAERLQGKESAMRNLLGIAARQVDADNRLAIDDDRQNGHATNAFGLQARGEQKRPLSALL